MVTPALYAMRARRYMENYGATAEDLARVVVKSRRCAAKNPHAQFNKETTVEQVLSSRMIADPLTLFMCCPTGERKLAAVVLCSAEKAKKYSSHPVWIKGSGSGIREIHERVSGHDHAGDHRPGLRKWLTRWPGWAPGM